MKDVSDHHGSYITFDQHTMNFQVQDKDVSDHHGSHLTFDKYTMNFQVQYERCFGSSWLLYDV